ncbi:DUF1576 domain-containing protein [Haloplasma contractile]|uniref:DUF1576 domain-containing protein n=1 Tax=Haloplasma contractile SSD-17B TaxID=1033810 RepID=U2EFQ3_9MOLU|nr:DUF1576 domain-containing protein [Haloplasma contractile]ERJ13471.1 hypothetical protein HLPCO_000122 [Haloplasma contractile SSD-17B]
MIYKLKKNMNRTQDVSNNVKVLIITVYAASLILFGLIVGDGPRKILEGLYQIIIQSDILISDYIGVGGIGAAFVNSGLITLIFIFILYKMKIQFNGAAVTALFLIAGFSLFGKNLFNVWFVVVGVFLYAKVQRERFSKYIYTALFGTAMAPVVTELVFIISAPTYVRIPLGIIVGILLGFILPPLASYLIRVHQGFNLYNIGFTAGVIGLIVYALLRSYEVELVPRDVWSTGNNTILAIYLSLMFISMIVLGFYLNKKSFNKLKEITEYTGRLVSDFILLEGFAPTLINMGINGMIALSYVLIVKGDLNGPTIGGIFTIVGFSSFGKHPKNILPIMLGVILGSLLKNGDLNDPTVLLAALFGTSLAPIAGEFGMLFGILAGFFHYSVVRHVGPTHGGLNLYNNGFSAGIVAAFLVPIIEAFRKDED